MLKRKMSVEVHVIIKLDLGSTTNIVVINFE